MSPRIPTSTYRLQFNRTFTFNDARAIVPYLHSGISDCYAAPYLQNAYVRIQSIFRKEVAASLRDAREETLHLEQPAERELAKRLCQFSEIVPTVLNDFRPNVLANYLFELANSFHSFYEACPVLKSEEPARSSRLALCRITALTLQRGLDLLGIAVPERM